jgi:lipoprotein-anchoring transpeptidase ErfK/SrfK
MGGIFPLWRNVMKVISVLVLSMLAFGCGYGSNYNSTPAMGAGTPAISGLAPNTATAGGAGFTLTANGSNFATSAVVYFNGAPETTTYVTAKQLTAAIPGSAIAAAGTKAVYVNSGGQNSPSMNFTVN